MAHDIAANTRAGKTEAEAINAIADHLRRFWTPAMRRQLVALAEDGPADFGQDVLEAAQSL